VSRRGVILGCSLATLLLSGCFDVHQVDPGPSVLDDFDDGDFNPTDPNFGAWFCSSYNQAGSNYSCDHAAGDESLYALVLQATLVDPMDGLQQNGGAELGTVAASPEDFTAFTEIGFQAKVDLDPIPSGATLDVEIACSTAEEEDGTVPGNLYVVSGVAFQPVWTSFNMTFTNFGPPPWLAEPIKGGTAGCLRRADAIRFSFDPDLPDGQTESFTLSIDDITLQ